MGAPFKLKSGNASSFKNMGSSPAKQDVKQKVTEGFSKNIHNPGPTTKVTTITPKGTTFVETSNKTGRVVSEGGGAKQNPAKVDLTKRSYDIKVENPKVAKKKAVKKIVKKKAKKKVVKKIAGKVLSRAIPGAGWALAAYDAAKFGKDWYQTGSAKKAWKKMWD